MRAPRRLLATLAFLLPLAAGCRGKAVPTDLPWVRTDLWETKPEVEMSPVDSRWARPVAQRIAFLGAAEVRDMSRVPAAQLIAFPKRTAGQIRALEQMAGSRIKWQAALGREPYFSFIPLGFEQPCPCTYRMGVRDAAGGLHELYRVRVEPVGPLSQATVDVDLSEFAGTTVEILLQVESDVPIPVAAGQPVPTALWGSPALYDRKAAPTPASGTASPKRPNVLLIGLDTLRADHVGPWRPAGAPQPSLTPELDRLAGESDVFLEAFSAFNVTNPSFASIFTGLYGKHHGVYDLKTPLPQEHVTLPELFKKAGYGTLAIISARHLGNHNSGLGQGFDEVTLADEHFAGELAADMAMDWIGARAEKSAPFFAWVHLFDPHTPHTPPQPYASGFRPAGPEGLASVRTWVPFRAPGPRAFDEPVLGANGDLYDGEVAYLDRQVGRLLGWLAARNLLSNTLVVVVADHGESLGEHGIRYRHVGLHDTTTHVPMMIRWPGERQKGRRLEGLVQTIDLFPTVLAAAGLPVPPQDGMDLRRLTGDKGKGRRVVFAEHANQLGLMARTREQKYIVSSGNTQFFPDGAALYDLSADPGEITNLAGKNLPAERELENLLRRFLADRGRKGPKPQTRDLPPEEIERLKALGYL